MLRFGWSPKDANFDKKYKIITKDMAVQLFLTEGNIKKSPSNLDWAKLDFLQRNH